MSNGGERRRESWNVPLTFLAGLLAGGASAVLYESLSDRRAFDPRLLRERPRDVPPVVVLPGILGSELLKSDGTRAWLNIGNAFGTYDLVPTSGALDLSPGGLLGVDRVLPRLFGFTEYADLMDLLSGAGFARDASPPQASCHVFTYDWRRDIVESARALDEALERHADAMGNPRARFTLVGHSMGATVARYFLRFGTEPPGGEITWAGARRVARLVLVAPPNAGSLYSLDAVLNGVRVGLSSTTLSGAVIRQMPSIYALLPAAKTQSLLGPDLEPLGIEPLDLETWERLSWGPFGPGRRAGERSAPRNERDSVASALERARAVQAALSTDTSRPCPCRVLVLGGDCLPTLGRAIVTEGGAPRFDPWDRKEAEALLEAGDGRVTRTSALAAHLPRAADSETGSGLPEVSQAFFGSADHHGIYSEPTFQSVLLRILLRPERNLEAPSP